MSVADYKPLRVYRLAFEAVMEIFELTKRFPPEERFSLTYQIRRSRRSVCANIAEAWRKRRYEAAFVSKLSDSDAEAAETEVHLDVALRCGYLDPATHAKLRDYYDHICRQLTNMMNNASSWCAPHHLLRELPPEYFVEASGGESVEPSHSNAPDAQRSDAPHAPDAQR